MIIGYGEDGLTYWALSNNKSLVKLFNCFYNEVNSIADEDTARMMKSSVIFYRPSFGRGKKCFGEFDAIIATENNVFLIESKWYKYEGETLKPRTLNKTLPSNGDFQKLIRRHETFISKYKTFNKMKLVKEPLNSLEKNTNFIFEKIGLGKTVNNVLLYFVPEKYKDYFKGDLNKQLKRADFYLVKYPYYTLNEWKTSHFFI